MPVIIVTGHRRDDGRPAVGPSSADDHDVFNLRELLARVRAIIRGWTGSHLTCTGPERAAIGFSAGSSIFARVLPIRMARTLR